MTWPFGGLPLGGVFLGQARGPLVELARLGGPLLITAGVWAGGVAVATLSASLWARRHRVGGPSAIGATAIVTGIVALAVAGALAPDGGAPVRTLRVALVQGGGQRGLSKQEVAPASVFEAQVAATLAVASAQPSPGLVLWPEDVVALDRPLAGSPQAALLGRLARELDTTLVAGVTEPASATTFRNEVVAWGPIGPHRRCLREGAPGALRRVRAVALPGRDMSPTSRACPSTPSPVTAAACCARRPDPSVCSCRSRSSTPAGATSRCAPAPSCSPCRPTRRRTARPRCRHRRSPPRPCRPSRRVATSSRRRPRDSARW